MKAATLVCATAQRSCQRLIQRGAAIAQQQGTELLVLSVSGSGPNVLGNPGVSEALNYLYAVSSEFGAEMTMLQAADAKKAISDFIRDRRVTHAVLGQGKPDPNGLIAQLMQAFPNVVFHIEPVA